jgi:hypothetical protein
LQEHWSALQLCFHHMSEQFPFVSTVLEPLGILHFSLSFFEVISNFPPHGLCPQTCNHSS